QSLDIPQEERLTRDALGYVEPLPGQDTADFAQCASCRMWTGRTCLNFGPKDRVRALGSCDNYVFGDPRPEMRGQESEGTTPEQAGYVERPVRCQNCLYAEDEARKCGLYDRLNSALPELYNLDVKVGPHACCNNQTPREGEPAQYGRNGDVLQYDREDEPPEVDEGHEPHILPLDDIRQRDTFSCGAAAAMTVGMYYGVGPKTLDEWKKALGTTEETSTRPTDIIRYLRSLGLEVKARQGMTLDDLRQAWLTGKPTITPIQEWGVPSKPASMKFGHYVVVAGLPDGQVVIQDPSIMNVITQGHEETNHLPEDLLSLAEEFVYLADE
ncbi:MAG: hypothetical protein KGL39_40105, partial [Patescibacteria group bacterium]|nr:hypothetical protein [Patescibacteria group bacterium]